MRILLLLALLLSFIGCKEKKEKNDSNPTVEAAPVNNSDAEKSVDFPEALSAIFAAHGGLDSWKSMRTLEFALERRGVQEYHLVDLYSRRDKVRTADYEMGFDGDEVWISDPQESYEGDPVFYHNLMFYFYAMPFVLADSGIHYGETEAIEYGSRSYPGIAISYGAEVGTSPEDEYYIHYDPETGKMAWLGYTVTYRSGEKSDDVRWIRYGDWQEVNGLLLPAEITWHNYEGRDIKDARASVVFSEVKLDGATPDLARYNRPAGARTSLPQRQ